LEMPEASRCSFPLPTYIIPHCCSSTPTFMSPPHQAHPHTHTHTHKHTHPHTHTPTQTQKNPLKCLDTYTQYKHTTQPNKQHTNKQSLTLPQTHQVLPTGHKYYTRKTDHTFAATSEQLEMKVRA